MTLSHLLDALDPECLENPRPEGAETDMFSLQQPRHIPTLPKREYLIASRMSASPSRPGELHPEPLTDPDLTLSRHPARAIA